MKKEVLFAIIIGFGIGLAITFGIYRAQASYQNSTQKNVGVQAPTPSPQPTVPPHYLTLTNPSPESVFTESPVSISGITTAYSYVTVVSPDYHVFTQADANGNFNLEFDLKDPATVLTVTALTPNQETSQQEIVVIYQQPQQAEADE